MLASMKNSLGTVANVGIQSYFLEQDIEKHLNDETPALEGVDIGIDVVKNGVELFLAMML